MAGSEFYPATLRVAVLWGGSAAEETLLATIKFLLARGIPVDIGVLPGESVHVLKHHGLLFHLDNSYLETFISAQGCKCVLCGTRTAATAAAVLELCSKYEIPAVDVLENVPLTVASVLAGCVANRHPEPRTVASDGRPLFPDMGYERYIRLMGIAQEVSRNMAEPLAILDIGGEDQALKDFLPGASYETFDGFITCDQGTGLPTASYDVVVASDVLEHVQPVDRRAFLLELVRLAKHKVVFSFPCARAEVHEQFLLGLFPQHRWLVEHQENGLPAVEEIEVLLGELQLKFFRVPNHSLQNWAYSVMFDVMPLAKDLRRALNLFLQEHVFELEMVEPSYRYIYVIGK